MGRCPWGGNGNEGRMDGFTGAPRLAQNDGAVSTKDPMRQASGASSDRPRVLKRGGPAPSEPDQAARAILEAFDAADREGSHPSSITVQWEDATLALDLQSWRGFRDRSLSLEAVATRLQIEASGDPEAVAKASGAAASLGAGKSPSNGAFNPSALVSMETLKSPYFLGGCGIVTLLGLFGILALIVRAASRRSAAPAAPDLPARGPASAPARLPVELHFLSGPLNGRIVPMKARVRIGREVVDNDLVLDDPSVSRHHALIESLDGGFQLKDLGSSNGTFLNGMRLDRPRQLATGDQLKVGQIQISVQ